MNGKGEIVGAGITNSKSHRCEFEDPERPFWQCPYVGLLVHYVDGRPDEYLCVNHVIQTAPEEVPVG